MECVCPSRETELPFTVISEASILPNSTYERDIDTLPVTVKSPKVADWAETVSNDVVAYRSVPLYILWVSDVKYSTFPRFVNASYSLYVK